MQTNLLEYLENTAAAFPDKVAFSDEKEEITFSQLLRLSKAVGSCITELSGGMIRRPVIVPVNHTVQNVVAFMGVLFSGNCYVPVDQNLPDQRLQHIITTTNPLAQVVFSQEGAREKIIPVSFSKAAAWEVNEAALTGIRDKIIDTDPAYIIFTSGTTGVPKGSVLPHRAVLDLTEWLTDTFDFTCKNIFGCQTPFYFDASVKDMYITLKTGATACLIPKKWFSFPLKLIELLDEKKVDTILWATSAVSLIASSGALEKQAPLTVKNVFFAGEVLHSKHLGAWQKALPDATFVNLYGPTEAAVDCTYYIVDREFDDTEPIPIGRPCRNMDVFLLDEEDKLIPRDDATSRTGEICRDGATSRTGEICIRGSGVSFGYYNDPERTDAVFVQNPQSPYYPEKIYRTGDFGKYNARGELVFVSRRDGQVKHMGNRIELGDIETALNSLPLVDAGICLYDEKAGKLVCIYQSSSGENHVVKKGLQERLPKYMLPNAMIKLAHLPYSANGKIDRAKLLENYRNGSYNRD